MEPQGGSISCGDEVTPKLMPLNTGTLLLQGMFRVDRVPACNLENGRCGGEGVPVCGHVLGTVLQLTEQGLNQRRQIIEASSVVGPWYTF